MIRLQQRLERRLDQRIRLTITDNRVVMFSFRQIPREGLRVRLHHMFLDADACTLDALVQYMRNKDANSRRSVQEFVKANRRKIRRKNQKRRKDPAGLAKGRVYDLNSIYADLNERFFRGRVRAHIQWGRHVRRKRRNSIKLGSYSELDRRIVISPTLDRRSIPKYVVEWVVYHEMLHDLLGFEVVNGVNYAHTPEFRRREQRYPHYHRACEWEERNIDKLLRS